MDVEARLEKLASEVRALRVRTRRLRAATIALSGTCAVVLLTAATGDVDAVRARRIEVLSSAGQPAIVLGTNDAGEGELSTLDGAGHMLVTLRASELGGGSVITFNRAGYELVSLGQTRPGSGNAVIFNGDGRKLAALTANENGDGEVRAHNRHGHMLAGVRATERAGGASFVLDARGRERVAIGGDASGHEPLRIFDTEGRPVLVLETPPGETARVSTSQPAAGSPASSGDAPKQLPIDPTPSTPRR